jgi:hypothetical protein
MNQVVDEGRNTVGSARPSPSKSPGAGISPEEPNGNAKKVESSLRRINHWPVDGRQKAMSHLPSPVKSEGTSVSVEAPNWNA